MRGGGRDRRRAEYKEEGRDGGKGGRRREGRKEE